MSGGLRQRCGSCGFWERLNDRDGECRYGPPCVDLTVNARGYWPIVDGSKSCGKGLPARFPERFEGRDQRDGQPDPNVRG